MFSFLQAKSEVPSRDMDISRPKCPYLSHELFSKLHSARLFPFESKACKYKTTLPWFHSNSTR